MTPTAKRPLLRRRLHAHKALIGDVFLDAVKVFAIEQHHDLTTRDLNERDRRSCEQRNILARNQVLVLRTVSQLGEMEQNEDEHSAAENAALERQLRRLDRALEKAGPKPC